MTWDAEKEKELEELINRFACYIKACIQRYHPNKFGVELDDVFQDVKIKIWKILRNEKKIVNYSSYIKKIVETSVIDQFRKFKREEGIYLEEKNRKISEQDEQYASDLIFEEIDMKDIVGKAVEELIETRRKVVKLYLLSMSIEEIAIYFHWSKDKTRNLLYRGLSDLKRILKEKNIDYENNR
jgi:RNA polymerase sigma factor (sigma-70 family)